VNFIRGVEPRFETDLMLPVQKQMELIVANKLPATWLLQFDALVSGPFVDFLKVHMPTGHEVGFWFEMNQKLCDAAGVEWRGRPGYEWDYSPPVAFTIGYTPKERIALAEAAMSGFEKVWSKKPMSVASWNLDSITAQHLVEKHGVQAFAVCRDQIATDGFTIWGAPIAGYYPSKSNLWSPAVNPENQISTPVFRMLGQDPVYYYDGRTPLPDGRFVSQPDTLEPVWISGQSKQFVDLFLEMIAETPSLGFAYAQMGQENSFSWPDMAAAFPFQMEALAKLQASGRAHVETMGDSGRRFIKAFPATPPQAQIQLSDPFGNTKPAQGSIWYQSHCYRANLHLCGDLPFLRDLTVYSDSNPQPYLHDATREHEVEQRMPAVLDGFHWSKTPGATTDPGAGGFLRIGDTPVRLDDRPAVTERGGDLDVQLTTKDGPGISVRFAERSLSFVTTGRLSLDFRWDPAKTAMTGIDKQRVRFSWKGFDYSIEVAGGEPRATQDGWSVTAPEGRLRLALAQAQ
jgi:hypothetical protein